MKRYISFVLSFIGLALLLSVVYMSFRMIGAISLGIFIYYCTRPIYRLLESRGVNRTISAIISQISIFIPVVLIIGYTSFILSSEVQSMLRGLNVSEIFQFAELFPVNQTDTNMGTILDSIDVNNLLDITDISISVLGFVSSVFFIIFISFSVSFYLQRDGKEINRQVQSVLNQDELVQEFLSELDKDLKVVYLGNIALSIVTSLIGIISFYLVSILAPNGNVIIYPGLIGILCGLASIIPIVGMKIVYFPYTGLIFYLSYLNNTLVESSIITGIFFFVALLVVDGIPDILLRPYISSWSGISTGVFIFSYVLGPITFGWYGLFLGPLLMVAFYEFFNIVLPELIESQLVSSN